ncbi:MAG TPA: hypothetical protein VK053_13450 [Jiangellaceae bacterium]|nr:hypothetical protein [Jiangellaceae bacterium]
MTTLFGVGYDVLWSVAALVGICLLALALVRWSRSQQTGLRSLLELAVIVFLPIIGPAAYLVATSRPGQGDQAAAERSADAELDYVDA